MITFENDGEIELWQTAVVKARGDGCISTAVWFADGIVEAMRERMPKPEAKQDVSATDLRQSSKAYIDCIDRHDKAILEYVRQGALGNAAKYARASYEMSLREALVYVRKVCKANSVPCPAWNGLYAHVEL